MENITIFPLLVSDGEIQTIFDNTYQNEYERYNEMFLKIHDPAKDKVYAAGLTLFMLGMGNGFKKAPVLNKYVINLYLHGHKLGYSIPQIIRSIPEIAKEYKDEKAEFRKINKYKLRLSWKNSNGILPGLVLYPPKDNKYFWGSVFEDKTDLLAMTREVANILALQDYVNYLKYLIENNKRDNIIDPLSRPHELKELKELYGCLENNSIKKFFLILQKHFAAFPYHGKSNEAFFHYHIAFVLNFLGCNVRAEDITNNGRIDCVIETFKYIYIVEFKESSVEKALAQIKNRKYYQKFRPTQKTIYLLGVAFDNKERNIIDWISEKLED